MLAFVPISTCSGYPSFEIMGIRNSIRADCRAAGALGINSRPRFTT